MVYDPTKLPKRKQSYHPRVGLELARTWAFAYGSAWLLAKDFMTPPGIFANSQFDKFDKVLTSMKRCHIEPEARYYGGKGEAYLWRLKPEDVEWLTYGGSRESGPESDRGNSDGSDRSA